MKKKRFNWRGMATFLLFLGMLVEIITGIILYITPPGSFAHWTNWTLWGLSKEEWGAVHTIFGYLLLIIIGLHLYYNWKVLVHFAYSKIQKAINLKLELVISSVITIFVFVGTLLYFPPFSTVMNFGEKTKQSWEKNSGLAYTRGNRQWALSSHGNDANVIAQPDREMAFASTSLDRKNNSSFSSQEMKAYVTSQDMNEVGVMSQTDYQPGSALHLERGRGFGSRSIEMICSENDVPTRDGLSRLQAKGIKASASDRIRDLANMSNRRPSEIVQIVTANKISPLTSLQSEKARDFSAKPLEDLKGRDFVDLGKITTLKGTLIQRGDEWGLNRY